MRLLLLAALLMMAGLAPANAADAGGWRKPLAGPVSAYRAVPRSAAASLVWAGDACWRGCAMDCGRQLKICLSFDSSGNCLAYNGSCDRSCQRGCRLYGGPLLAGDW